MPFLMAQNHSSLNDITAATTDTMLGSVPSTSFSHFTPVVPFTDQLDHYIRTNKISEGAASSIYEAIHVLSNRKVVLKIQSKQRRALVSLETEVFVSAQVKHPSICQLYAVIDLEDSVIMVCEYLEGPDLFDAVVVDVGLPEYTVRSYIHQLSGAIQYLHHRNIAHRDIKPENVVLSTKTGSTIKLIDFGLSAVLEKSTSHTIVGTIPYMSFELVECLGLPREKMLAKCANIDWKMVDVWALGIVMFTLLTGRFPWGRACMNSREYVRYLDDRSTQLPWSSLETSALKLLHMMLEPDPKKRATIDQLVTFMRRCWKC
ncbi:serine/threonine protein kinase [Sphaeroforma arctica JP610]|uniref:Serine/threonine protein kinase n=1 Tax=Sphaeroforma arctica JP610 TaxID=667725 RepID=A0A0L0GC02_9EUKA|nr:serine/threonine protein kinase [Sphaeroforma arctica JP610]KNC85783.1 serine/threonine protein kinase [Sphaeroforma arctica JP610]|eukprot:XP_014159685.1 serine/threonine protein kinase [Sphaeroforma arctica JP610]